ncbi:MAG: hypothetical protein H3C35_08045 [Bacteroidetes bacterium]|nr:hypothetical protein [Bacteroidota bacterium]
MKKIIFSICILSSFLFSQNKEALELRRTLSIQSDSLRFIMLDSFLVKYPDSEFKQYAYNAQYSIYMKGEKYHEAFVLFNKFLSTIPVEQSFIPLAGVALDLATRNIYIDSASQYIDSALARSSRYSHREDLTMLNTRALISFIQKDYPPAESVQTYLISLLPKNAEFMDRYQPYYALLGMIQFAEKKYHEALPNIVQSQLLGTERNFSGRYYDSLFTVALGNSKNAQQQKEKIYFQIIHNYFRSEKDTVAAKMRIATVLADHSIFLSQAEQYARDAYRRAQSHPGDNRSKTATTLARALSANGKIKEAEKYFKEAVQSALPDDVEPFLLYGTLLEKTGKKKEAFSAYLSGMSFGKNATLYRRLVSLHHELFPALSLDSMISAVKTKALAFTPEKYRKPRTKKKNNEIEKVILAELFTGSECPPCAAADIAFDYLSERFDSTALVILEYHQNIPMPDPMTNPSTEARARFYNINSTPTAIFGGTSVLPSGGNKEMAKGKFQVYNDIIQKELEKNSTVKILSHAKRNGTLIAVTAEVAVQKINPNLRVQVVLAEDEVFYAGSNGVTNHKYVVRYMMNGGNGFSFEKKSLLQIQDTIDVQAVEAELKKYSDEVDARSSSARANLKERRDTINKNHLSLVVFVQDVVTKEVLQSKIVKIH